MGTGKVMRTTKPEHLRRDLMRIEMVTYLLMSYLKVVKNRSLFIFTINHVSEIGCQNISS